MKHKYLKKSNLPKLIIILIIIVAGIWLMTGRSNQQSKLTYPAYLNYNAKFVFTIPSSYTVDSRTLSGIEIVHSGNLTAKTYDDIYNAGDVTLEPITTIKDQSGKAFKDYVNNTFVPSLKKKYASSQIKTQYGKVDGWDIVRVSVIKSGATQRFAYLKNGKHPVAILSKDENSAAKIINRSITDVESSPLKDEISPLKQAFKDNVELITNQDAVNLYKQAAPDLRSVNTEAQLAKILQGISILNNKSGGISIYDGIYNGKTNEFNAIMNILPAKSGDPSSPVAVYLAKINGQWKLKGLSILIAPAKN